MAQIFANYPAAYLSTGLGLAEEVNYLDFILIILERYSTDFFFI